MDIIIIREKINSETVKKMAQESFIDMVKAVVDIEQEIIALGGELHADAEKMLLEQGSAQKNLWGINIYPDEPKNSRIEFISLINIRPSLNNKSMKVEDESIRKKIEQIIEKLIQ